MKNRDGLENNDHWKTPYDLYKRLNDEFHFDFDPCPLYHNIDEWDGLKIEWGQRNYINPPYNRLDKPKFIEKAIEEWRKDKLCVILIPASTSTKLFHKYFWDSEAHKPRRNVQIRFLKGRVSFEGYNTKGEFTNKCKGKHDSMLIILKPNK